MYSSENMAKLRQENQLQFVVVPLQRREQVDDEMLQYVDATELVPPEPVPVEASPEEMDAMSFEEDDNLFRTKQAEAARALRAKMRQGDSVIHQETNYSDEYDSRPQQEEHKMQVDDEEEAQEEDLSDGEEEERKAIDAEQPVTGRHYFQDAVTKKKHDAMDSVRGREKEVDQFFNAPEAEDIEWELELLKRSGVKRSHQTSQQANIRSDSQRGAQKRVEIEPIPERAVEPLSEEEIIRRIENDISQLQSISALHENRLASIESAKTEHGEFLSNADSAFSRASEDLRYFEELRLYVVDLMDCVESKMPLIGEVEERMFSARLRRQKKTQLRIKTAFQLELERLNAKKPSVSSESTPWMEWRAAHRSRRGDKVRDSEPLQFHDPHLELEEGYSSDEETTPEDQLAFEESLVEIGHAARNVFEDALQEFSDLRLILSKFSEFRSKYQFSYQQAHVQTELKTLLSPFVRLETVSWDPLKSHGIYDWPWFEVVDEFDLGAQDLNSSESGTGVKKESNPVSSHVCADIASEVLYPRVKDTIKFFWRPNSAQETLQLQQLLGKLRALLAPKLLSDLLVAVHMNLQHAIMNVNLPMNYQASQSSDYGRIAFVRLLKFISITLLWKPFFSPDALSNIIWNNIVNDKMLPFLKSLTKDKSTSWNLLALLFSALAPFYSETFQQPSTIERSAPVRSFLKELENDSLGHYETFEISQNVREFWDSCTAVAK